MLVGENEIASGEFAVKNLASGEQTKVAREGLEFLDQHKG
jgi:histidyl-tRNA synthetase